MNNQNSFQDDEIDLRKYIEIIIKRWRFILSIFFIGVSISAISSFIEPKVYKATTILMITPSANQAHITLLKANIVLEKIIKKLNLKDPLGKTIPIENLTKKMNVQKTSDQDTIVELQVINVNPQTAKDIANAWPEQYIEYRQELLSQEMPGTGDLITTQFEISKKNLLKSENMINNFKKEYKQDLMTAELTLNKKLLNNYKSELAGSELLLKTMSDSLVELKKQIAIQEKFIIVSKAITDDALLQMSSKKNNTDEMDKKKIRSESINPVYQDLETRIVNTDMSLNLLKLRIEYLQKSIEPLIKEIETQDNKIIQKNFEFDQLMRQMDICKKSYDALANRIQGAHDLKLGELGEVKIVSSSNTPQYPIDQGKLKKIALAGFLSLIVGFFLTLFMDFLQKNH